MSLPPNDNGPDTLLRCEACNGEGCAWCSSGYQNVMQTRSWYKFRVRMQSISSTYALVEDVFLDLIERLKGDDSDQAMNLTLVGHSLLEKWRSATPVKGTRLKITDDMRDFNTKALDYLLSR